jgi:hypothetical protein
MNVSNRNRNFFVMGLTMVIVSLGILAMMTYAANIL